MIIFGMNYLNEDYKRDFMGFVQFYGDIVREIIA